MAPDATGSYPASGGSGRLRRAILGIVVALLGTGCAGVPSIGDPADLADAFTIRPSSSPYSEVTAGSVQALVPDGWRASPAGGARTGFVASPRPEAWRRMDGSMHRDDGRRPGSMRPRSGSVRFYYLAATGPLCRG